MQNVWVSIRSKTNARYFNTKCKKLLTISNLGVQSRQASISPSGEFNFVRSFSGRLYLSELLDHSSTPQLAYAQLY